MKYTHTHTPHFPPDRLASVSRQAQARRDLPRKQNTNPRITTVGIDYGWGIIKKHAAGIPKEYNILLVILTMRIWFLAWMSIPCNTTFWLVYLHIVERPCDALVCFGLEKQKPGAVSWPPLRPTREMRLFWQSNARSTIMKRDGETVWEGITHGNVLTKMSSNQAKSTIRPCTHTRVTEQISFWKENMQRLTIPKYNNLVKIDN